MDDPMRRAAIIVLDGLGIGPAPDTAAYGDAGSDTLGNVARAVGPLRLPRLAELGLGRCAPLPGLPDTGQPTAAYGVCEPRSPGKDSTTGHWEICGVLLAAPFPSYPDGFPAEVIEEFSRRTGRGVLGNRPASGTAVLDEFGEEHQRTGKWIVYTSADSVFQIAAHEETVPLEELYGACRIAREILTGKHAVGRVIARPFVGSPGTYERTPNRHDFSLEPRRPNYLTLVREAGHKVYGVGKIPDIFAHQDVDEELPTKSNVEGIQRTEELLRTVDEGFIFTNLVETDSLWGHRNDPENFHRCLQDFDRRLPDLLDALRPNDLLILTSDHGCDPTTPSTDHSREHALLLVYVEGRNAAGRIHEGEFADVGATVNAWLGGKSARGLPGSPIVEP
jgi:phosphopentomutase